LRALGQVTQAVNSTVDLETVLTTIVAKATQLSSTEAGAIYVFDNANQEFQLRATYGLDDAVVAELRDSHIRIGETAISDAVEQRMPIQIPDIQNRPSATLDVIVRVGFRALLVVPLMGTDRIVGERSPVRRAARGRNLLHSPQNRHRELAAALQHGLGPIGERFPQLAETTGRGRAAHFRLATRTRLATPAQARRRSALDLLRASYRFRGARETAMRFARLTAVAKKMAPAFCGGSLPSGAPSL
jgi:hypothetical protein